MAALVDTNVLIYAVDPRDPNKQTVAERLLREGSTAGSLKLPHQALIEFVSVATRPGRGGGGPLLVPGDARRAVAEFLAVYEVLYPTQDVLRLALRGAEVHQMSWFDAHLWAYAEHFGLDTLYSEDFQHDRVYGSVRVINPFA